MSRMKNFAIAHILLGSGWAIGQAQRPEPEFMLSIDAPVGEARIECVSGCQLIGARDVDVPSAGRMKSYTFSCTTTRLAAVHLWPVVPNPPHRQPSIASSSCASSMIMMTFLPPISRCVFLNVDAAC